MLQRLCRRLPEWFGEIDRTALQDVAEEFRELVDDLTETQERAKLLQEELAARLAEQTNSNLYILSLFTAILFPPSLIAGIFSWILMPFIAGVVAVICGHMARGEIKRSNGTLEGDGLAIAGLVLGWINVVLCVLAVAAVVLFFGGLAVLLGWLGMSGQL